MAVNIKFGVDISDFKSKMQQAQTSVKTMDAQLKANEAQFKATGNAQDYMAKKADTLRQKLEKQKQIYEKTAAALKTMSDNGGTASAEYQKMSQTMLNAEAAMYETQAALNGLNTSQINAANSADKLTQSVNSIGKKISLDQVISGINKITGALENAAKKAAEVGKEIWNNMMMSAERGDQIATNAAILDMDVENYQRYVKVFNTVGEITINEWRNAKKKIEKAMTDPSNDQTDALKALGINMIDKIPVEGIRGAYKLVARDWEDVFWDVADELTNRVKNGKLSEAQADVYAQAILGNKYDLYKPLLNLGREEFNKELEEQLVLDQESVNKLATLNDEIIELKGNFETLQDKVLAGLAPALTAGAEALSDLLGKLMQYLNTPKGQQMLENLGTAVSGLFEDLSNIDPQAVVEGFSSVFEKIVGGLEWLVDNKETIFYALEWIVGGWATLKLTGGALDVLKVINGAKGLVAGSGGSEATAAAASASSSGSGFLASLGNKAAVGVMVYPTIKKLLEEGIQDIKPSDVGKTALDIIGGEGTGALLDKVKPVTKVTVQEAVYKELGIGGGGDSGGHGFAVPVEPVAPDNSAEIIRDEIGTITVPVKFSVGGGGGGGGGGKVLLYDPLTGLGRPRGFANGIPFVNDTQLAILHRGERVLTASENKHYTYNNNTYFGSVNLHNGLEIDALTESIARNNRRKSSGYGS